jgi:uncharacterized membrane protein
MTEPHIDFSQITRAESINALVHLYRGELGEAAAWRNRIDTTSHWAIVVSATALTFMFSDPGSERHVIIPIVSLFCTWLLQMEARRYRYFDIWRSRARMLEINFYRPLLDGTAPAMHDWAERLALDMAWPRFHMPWWEAAGRRLRRSYQWIYVTLLGSWLVALMSRPFPTTSMREVTRRAAIGPFPGYTVVMAMAFFYGSLAILGAYSFWMSRIGRTLPAGHPARMQAAPRHDDP